MRLQPVRWLACLAAMCTVVARTFVAAPLGQVSPPRDTRVVAAPVAHGIIRGRVVRADTQQPLRRASVLVTSRSGSRLAQVTSDADGRFVIQDVPAGEYILRASRNGFAPMDYGQRRPFELPQVVTVAPAGLSDAVEFAMTPAAAVTGQVVDENGEPIMGASVTVSRIRYVNRTRTLVVVGRSRPTDDLGSFRVGNLPQGEYILGVAPRLEYTSVIEQEYAPTFFPGVSSSGDAGTLRLTAGQEMAGIVFPVGNGRTSLLNGTVTGLDPDAPVTVTLRSTDFGGLDSRNMVTRSGRFGFPNVPPGEYLLETSRLTPAGTQQSIGRLRMSGTDATVSIPFRLPTVLRGHIGLEASSQSPALRPTDVTVVIDSLIGDRTVTSQARVREDGTFEAAAIRGWPALIHARTPSGWAVTRVTRRNTDFGETPPLDSDVVEGIEVVLTSRLAQVIGTVYDDAGIPVVAAAALLVRDPSAGTAPPRMARTARLNRDGTFILRDVPYGSYIVVALEHIEDGIEADPEWLARVLKLGTTLSISKELPPLIQLRLTSEP